MNTTTTTTAAIIRPSHLLLKESPLFVLARSTLTENPSKRPRKNDTRILFDEAKSAYFIAQDVELVDNAFHGSNLSQKPFD